MAEWKKVIVSGSQASLAGISGSVLTDNALVFSKGAAGALTSVSGVSVTTDGHLDGIFSGSASGSFEGDGSGLTGVVATIENDLTDGNGIADFTFDGSAAISIAVEADGSTLSVGASGVKVSDGGIDTTQLADEAVEFAKIQNLGTMTVIGRTAAGTGVSSEVSILDEDAMTSNSATALATQQSIKAYVDAQVTAADLDITDGTNTDSIDLDSETLTFTGGGGITATVSAGTVTFGATVAELGGGLVSGSTQVVEHLPDGTVSGSSQVFADVSGDVLINSSGVATIQADSVALGTDTTGDYVATLTAGNGITSTGAATGEGIAHSLSVDYGSGANQAVQGDVTLAVVGTANEIEVTNGAASALGANRSITIGLPDDVTITGDLTVLGDTTTLSTTNLLVEDKFILLASGSTADSDGGIIIDGGDDNGEGFVYDASAGNASDAGRWGFQSGMSDADGTQTSSPVAFASAVVIGTDNTVPASTNRYTAKGNMFIASNEDIFIYA